jgi:hypothetical protein
LIRAFAFFIFASAYWADLPLIARNQVAGGPALCGFLLAAIGLGAVIGRLHIAGLEAAAWRIAAPPSLRA